MKSGDLVIPKNKCHSFEGNHFIFSENFVPKLDRHDPDDETWRVKIIKGFIYDEDDNEDGDPELEQFIEKGELMWIYESDIKIKGENNYEIY